MAALTPQADWIHSAVVQLGIALALLGVGCMGYFIVVLAKKKPMPPPYRIAVIIGIWISIGTIEWVATRGIHNRPRSPAPTYHVRILAQQFSWLIQYPGRDGKLGNINIQNCDPQLNPMGLDDTDPAGRDDVIDRNSLRLPVNISTELQIQSLDVVHGFSVPGLGIKQDIIPGRPIHIQVYPTKLGTSPLLCAQLCGLGHSRMKGVVTIVQKLD